MADIFPNIKPSGLTLHREVDMWYQLWSSIAGICAKLDADGGVTDTTYTALCYTAISNTVIRDSKGNRTGVRSAEKNFHEIGPNGISDPARLELIYRFFNALETLCEQLDADAGVSDTDHEALCYTALMTQRVENPAGTILGNGTTNYKFTPGGVDYQKELVELFYNAVNAIETLTEQLDAGGGVTDTDYEALWFTANILTRVENAAGSTVGNTSTT